MQWPVLDLLSIAALAMTIIAGAFTFQKIAKAIQAKRRLAHSLAGANLDEAGLQSILDDLRDLEESDAKVALTAIHQRQAKNPLFAALSQMPWSIALEAMSALTQPSDLGRERYVRDLVGSAGGNSLPFGRSRA